MELEKLLKKISLTEYQKFTLLYSLKNPEFKTELEVYFADKDEKIDLTKKYSEWIKKTIRKYEHKGFIDYKNSRNLASDLQSIINTGFVLVEEHNFLDAFTLAKIALKETMEVIPHCDDSSGSIGDTVSFSIQLLEGIANDPYVARPLKDQLFLYLDTVLKDDIYFDYGDFGYELLAIFEMLAIKTSKTEVFIKYLDYQLSKPDKPYSDYRGDFYKTKKIEFLTTLGRLDEVEELIIQNLDVVEVRKGVVDKAIDDKDYRLAKALIADGIKIAKEKNHPGTVSNWERELLSIAFLEKDIKTIRLYTKYFAFDGGFIKEYYRMWKGTYTPGEWTEVLEAHLQESITFVLDIYEKNKKKGWMRQSPLSLLSTVASIYIEENYLDRLLALVKEDDDLDRILYYHGVLVQEYPSDLLQIYLPAIKKSGVNTSDRKQYKDFVIKLKKIMKDIPEGKDQILEIAKELRKVYYRRPAMVEELNKLIG